MFTEICFQILKYKVEHVFVSIEVETTKGSNKGCFEHTVSGQSSRLIYYEVKISPIHTDCGKLLFQPILRKKCHPCSDN